MKKILILRKLNSGWCYPSIVRAFSVWQRDSLYGGDNERKKLINVFFQIVRCLSSGKTTDGYCKEPPKYCLKLEGRGERGCKRKVGHTNKYFIYDLEDYPQRS